MSIKKVDVLNIIGVHWINLYSIVMYLVRDDKMICNKKGDPSVRATLTTIKRILSTLVDEQVIERIVTGHENVNSTYYRRKR